MGCTSSRALPISGVDPKHISVPSANRTNELSTRSSDPSSDAGHGSSDGALSAARSADSSTAKAADTLVASALRSKRSKARGPVILGDGEITARDREEALLRRVPKSAATRAMLLRALHGNVLFGAYGPTELDAMVDALEPRSVEPGTTVINQGDAGDNFYVIESGKFEILKGGVRVADWGEGTPNWTFGELALLYNSPRAASVRAVAAAGAGQQCRLWSIDRRTFRAVVAHAALAQHRKLKSALKRGLLEDLSDEQLDRIADAATIVKYSAGEQIIKKGEVGEVFFIIEEGSVICRNMSGDQSANVLHAGDYFGERALLKSEPRAADVFAEEEGCTLIALHREDFVALLGHLRELLEYNVGMRLLLCMPILSALSDDDRAALFSSLRLATFSHGQVLMQAGSVPREFYIVKEGCVRVLPTGADAAAAGAAGERDGEAEPRPLLSRGASTATAGSSASGGSGGGSAGEGQPLLLLLPGHFFPARELKSQSPLPVTYVASTSVAAAGQPTPIPIASASSSSNSSGGSGGVVECFVTDRLTYMKVLAPYVTAMMAQQAQLSAASGGASSNSSGGSGGLVLRHTASRSRDGGGGGVSAGAGASRGGSTADDLNQPLTSSSSSRHHPPSDDSSRQSDVAASTGDKSSVHHHHHTSSITISRSDGLGRTSQQQQAAQAAAPASSAAGGSAGSGGGTLSNRGSGGGATTTTSNRNISQQQHAQSSSGSSSGSGPLQPNTMPGGGTGTIQLRTAGGGSHNSKYAQQDMDRPPRRRLGIPFKELEQRATVGTGTFGRVRLVMHRRTNRVFALKILQKAQVVALKQQGSILNERALLWRVDHPFITKLYDTYRDRDRLYMLLELVQGGELFSRLQNAAAPGRIGVDEARFYAACVLDALDYMHAQDILYRDLKPENLLIDQEGYLKLVDFGFAKIVHDKTFTLCGTPEYLAPELVLGRGHDKGVDYWALGVLLFEMVSGYSPFADHSGNDQMVICRNILRGEFEFPPHVKDKDLRDLIQRLLVKDVTKRLGCLRGGASDVKAHRFFRTIDWDALYRKAVPAPWRPVVRSLVDTSNFDQYDEDDRVEPYRAGDDPNAWDKDF